MNSKYAETAIGNQHKLGVDKGYTRIFQNKTSNEFSVYDEDLLFDRYTFSV